MEKTAELPIIADTSALVSLATTTAQNYVPATVCTYWDTVRAVSRPIILPSDVFVETVNVLGKRSGHKTALKAADELLRPGSQFVLIESNSYLLKTLERFKDVPVAVSLTDCIVMAVADDYGTKDILGFDRQFVEAGYHRLEPSVEWKQGT
jgi:uncharacterized protein